jgi:hypothetical protein
MDLGGLKSLGRLTNKRNVNVQETNDETPGLVVPAPEPTLTKVKGSVEYIDVTPSWEEIHTTILFAYEYAEPAGRKIAGEELKRMAQAADNWNKAVKENRLMPEGWNVLRLPDSGFPVEATDDNTTYLGDAVYCTKGRWPGEFIVWTDREVRHHMSLEPDALQSLINYARNQGWNIK